MKNQFKRIFLSPVALVAIMLAALLPTFLCLFYFFQARDVLQQLEGRLSAIKAHQFFVSRSQAQEADRLQKLRGADSAYIEKDLESLVFLGGEIKRLQALANERNAERLRFLTEGRNSLKFIENNFRKKPPIEEADVRLEHPVEMDNEDLKILLQRIEGIQAPELVIRQFDLTRRSPVPQEEVYLINLELIKREIIRE